jgi:hypothetical protein
MIRVIICLGHTNRLTDKHKPINRPTCLPQSISHMLNACNVVLGVHGMDCLSEGDVTSKTVWLLEPTSNRIIIDPLSWTELIEERVSRKKRRPMRESSRSLFSGDTSSTPIGKRQPTSPAATIAPPVLPHSPEEIIARLRVVGFGRAEMINLYPIVEEVLSVCVHAYSRHTRPLKS